MTATTILPTRAAVVAWLADTGERVVRTFVQAFLAVFVPLLPVPGTTLHWDTLQKAAAAGVAAGAAAVLAFLTALLARWSGNPATASFVKTNVIDVEAAELIERIDKATTRSRLSAGVISAPSPVVVNVYQGSDPKVTAGAGAKRVGRSAKGHGRVDLVSVLGAVLLVVVILFVLSRI